MGSRRFVGFLAAWLLVPCACARPNPSFGVGSATDTGGVGESQSSSTSATGDASGVGTGGVTSLPTSDDSGTTTYSASSDDSTSDTETLAESTGAKGCETVIIDVDSDTFVSNAEAGCGGGSCADWTFTGIGNYDIETAGQLDVVALLRFIPREPLAEVTAARVDVQIMGPLPPGAGLFEVHVLDTTSEWVDGSTMGPIPGQPTFNEARAGEEEWRDAEGNSVPDFDALRDDWPTVPVLAGDDDDGVLELPIQAEDDDALKARLSAAAPVIIGITVLGGADGAVTMLTLNSGAPAELRLTVCG